jgi:immune inhibitor A
MRSSTHLKTQFLLLILLITFSANALAVMPPAPPEWYQRINMPVPEGIKSGQMPNTEQIEKDLARAAEKRASNTDNILLILVEFSDNAADQINHPPQAYDDLMFSTGVIPTGSMVEYYQEVSYGAFTPAGTVTVWIMAPNPYTYYTDGSYGMGSYPNNSQGLLEDCVNILDPALDFSLFDNNDDGSAEGIFLVHAGPAAEETGNPDDIWSHAWYHEVETDDGVYTGRYSTEPEEHYDGSMATIGVYCHEYGHVLGLPDLYDTDGSSEGIGVYCLMAAGSWGALPGNPERPTHMSALMKTFLNWLTPTEVTGNLADLVIPPVETTPVCYQVSKPGNPIQFYLIENRAKIGFDSLFRGDGGLAIWHVDYDGWQSNENHRLVSLEQADGNGDLERDHGGGNRHPRTNRGDAGDLYPGATGNRYFSFSSDPNSYDYDGTDAFVTVDEIEHYGDSMLVDIYTNPDVPLYRLHDVHVVDTALGEGLADYDGDADSGEVVDVIVTLACDGEGASIIAGAIVTTDPRVVIIDGITNFASSTHNDYTSTASAPFRVEVTSSSTDSAVTFDLNLNADGDTYDMEFKLNINRQKILVVLDNNDSRWSRNLVDAMHLTGHSFDLYTVNGSGSPQRDDLIPYHAVLWTTASYFGTRTAGSDYELCINPGEVTSLKEYLDDAGRLGLFSQDYIYDRGIDAFVNNYMYVSNSTEDESSTHIVGVAGTFTEGFDGLTPQWTYYDYTDYLTPRSGGEAVMEDDLSGGTVMVNHPSTPQSGLSATTFSSFGIERLDDLSLMTYLADWCDWILTDIDIDVPIPISPINGDSFETTEAPLFQWTASDGAVSYNIQVATDFDFTNIIRDTSVPTNSTMFAEPFDAGTYYWRVNASPPSKAPTAYSPRAVFSLYTSHVCGDANGDGEPNVGDAVFLIAYVFKGGPPPDPLCTGDANGDDDANIGDAVFLIAYVFKGGPPPLEPCCP